MKSNIFNLVCIDFIDEMDLKRYGYSYINNQLFSSSISENNFLFKTDQDMACLLQLNKQEKLFNGINLGILLLDNIVIFGKTVIIDLRNNIILYGASFGSSKANTINELNKFIRIEILPNDLIALDGQVPYSDHKKNILFIGAPGYSIYGHWLTDIIPNLYKSRQFKSEVFFCTKPKAWTENFLKLFGYSLNSINIINSYPLKVDHLKLPVLSRKNYLFDFDEAPNAWRFLRRGLKDMTKPGIFSYEKIFISRERWGKRRVLSLSERSKNYLKSKNFELIFPEKYTIEEQSYIFNSASIVLGEDGSGMHNIVLTEKEQKLGIFSMGRINQWHAGIAAVFNKKISYFDTNFVEKNHNGVDIFTLQDDEFISTVDKYI